MDPVIVFGPTGNIGSVVAQSAAQAGGKVVLAMRDITKAIPGMSLQDERAAGFVRAYADLEKAETVSEAVRTTGAKRAFTYLPLGSPDNMRSAFEAMEVGGIEFVVFLSSVSVGQHPSLEGITEAEVIPYAHAQSELHLRDVFGAGGFVAVRPGVFITNLLRYRDEVIRGTVRLFAGDFKVDCTTPEEMGRVGAALLMSGPRDGQQHVYLFGPQIISQREAAARIGQAVGKDITIIELDEEEGLNQLVADGMHKHMAEYMVRAFSTNLPFPSYHEGVRNIMRYAARSATTFEQWVETNLSAFAA